MTTRMIRIHNVETDEVIDREMTAEESAEVDAREAKMASDETAKATGRSALLTKLGLTAEEAASLLS